MTKVYTYVLVGRFQELKDVTTSGKESVCSSLSIRSDGTDMFIEQFHSGQKIASFVLLTCLSTDLIDDKFVDSKSKLKHNEMFLNDSIAVGDAPSFIHPDRARPHPVAVVKFRRGDVQLAMTFRLVTILKLILSLEKSLAFALVSVNRSYLFFLCFFSHYGSLYQTKRKVDFP